MSFDRTRRVALAAGAAALLFGACQEGAYLPEDSTPDATNLLAPQQVGELVFQQISSPAIATPDSGEMTLVWKYELQEADATYIAPHFEHFKLPEGAFLQVEGINGVRSVTYAGEGKVVPDSVGFWGTHLPGTQATLELYSSVAVPAGAVRLDRYARGTDAYLRFQEEYAEKALCGADDSEWAQCKGGTMYDKSRAVARLLIGGTGACTGWLVGSEGHLMTNEHCITTNSEAGNTDYEFMAEGSCNTNCASWGACPGTVAASSGTLVKDNATLDYALILLPNNPSNTYGYLQMRNAGAQLGEQIYIPQHPQAWGKKIADTAGSSPATVTTVTAAPCSGGQGNADVGYMADTQGGSSGSPVIGTSDHAVIALHHCANCPNRGVPIDKVIGDLGSSVPADATVGGAPPPPPACFPAGDSCSSNSDCCSNRCRGRSGRKTCK